MMNILPAATTVTTHQESPQPSAVPSVIAVPSVANADTVTLTQLEEYLTIASPNLVGYNRDFFGDWTFTTGDGCDTRANLLKAQSQVPVTFSAGCTVATGQWVSWYDEQTWTLGSQVQIDHLVPLAEAWASGATGWTDAQRSAFANDTSGSQLQIVTSSVYESNGHQDPTVWMPPAASAECQYITDWVLTKYRWSLSVDVSEQSAIAGYLANNHCGDQTVSVPTVQIPRNTSVTLPTVATSTSCSSTTGTVTTAGGTGVAVSVLNASDYSSVTDASHLAPGDYYVEAGVNDGQRLLDTDLPAGWTAGDGESHLVFHALYAVTVASPVACASSSLASPVYRFWSPTYHTHFFTISTAERDQIVANYPKAIWTYEGNRYSAFAAQENGTVPLFRFYSAKLGGHFFTTNADERDGIIAHYDTHTWHYEGVAYYVYPIASSAPDSVPVARFWSPTNQHHFYTASAEEAAVVKNYPAATWSYEGDNFRVPTPAPAMVLSLSYSCLTTTPGSINVVAQNPNGVPEDVSMSFDFGGDGSVDASGGFTIGAGAQGTAWYGPAGSQGQVGVVTAKIVGTVVWVSAFTVTCASPPPPPPVVTTPSGPPSNPGDSKNCTDFSTWAHAQNWFNTYYPYYGDVARLDGDNDLIACESLPGHP